MIENPKVLFRTQMKVQQHYHKYHVLYQLTFEEKPIYHQYLSQGKEKLFLIPSEQN